MLVCYGCSIEFEPKYKACKNKYHSQECMRSSRKIARSQCVCLECGNTFEEKVRQNPNKFCSKLCSNRNTSKTNHQKSMLKSKIGRYKYEFVKFSYKQHPLLFDPVETSELIKKYGIYHYKNNPKGIQRDHRVSVKCAILNNLDPYYITHPVNCKLLTFQENNQKRFINDTGCSITYEQLIQEVNKYDEIME